MLRFTACCATYSGLILSLTGVSLFFFFFFFFSLCSHHSTQPERGKSLMCSAVPSSPSLSPLSFFKATLYPLCYLGCFFGLGCLLLFFCLLFFASLLKTGKKGGNEQERTTEVRQQKRQKKDKK